MNLFTLENITISRDWLTPIGVALVLLSFYWFRRAYKRHQGQEGDEPPRGGSPRGGSRRRRQRYTKADQDAIREKARRSL